MWVRVVSERDPVAGGERAEALRLPAKDGHPGELRDPLPQHTLVDSRKPSQQSFKLSALCTEVHHIVYGIGICTGYTCTVVVLPLVMP